MTDETSDWAVGSEDVDSAAEQLAGHAVRTPLLRYPTLDGDTGRRVFVKPEMLQVSGSFKFRGAFNRLSRLSPQQRRRGVVAWSSGNHAQGVAAAARRVGVAATIVMPVDAPRVKLDNTRALGARVITYDRYREDREAIARALAAEQDAVLVPSYDDPHIIAGQGTVGRELLEDVAKLGERLDALLICCGGGGLTAGCLLAMRSLSPGTRGFTVEPEGYDDHARSFASGRREAADTSRRSLCDALLAPRPGCLTFPINQALVSRGLVVSEAEVRHAMRYAFRVLKLVVEPGGAVALAALLAGRLDDEFERVGVVLSGGNVDAGLFAAVLAGD